MLFDSWEPKMTFTCLKETKKSFHLSFGSGNHWDVQLTLQLMSPVAKASPSSATRQGLTRNEWSRLRTATVLQFPSANENAAEKPTWRNTSYIKQKPVRFLAAR